VAAALPCSGDGRALPTGSSPPNSVPVQSRSGWRDWRLRAERRPLRHPLRVAKPLLWLRAYGSHMDRTAIDAVDDWAGPADVKRNLGGALGTAHVAVKYYELAPGETFGFGYHRHPDQEEVFYVLAGTATFETESGDVPVGPDEAVRFAPGEWQLGRNAGDERVRALALGAPADAGDAEMLRECVDCGGRTDHRVQRADDGEGLVTVCGACGTITGRFD
jgi:uncharacterized cupin superfamily protein